MKLVQKSAEHESCCIGFGHRQISRIWAGELFCFGFLVGIESHESICCFGFANRISRIPWTANIIGIARPLLYSESEIPYRSPNHRSRLPCHNIVRPFLIGSWIGNRNRVPILLRQSRQSYAATVESCRQWWVMPVRFNLGNLSCHILTAIRGVPTNNRTGYSRFPVQDSFLIVTWNKYILIYREQETTTTATVFRTICRTDFPTIQPFI